MNASWLTEGATGGACGGAGSGVREGCRGGAPGGAASGASGRVRLRRQACARKLVCRGAQRTAFRPLKGPRKPLAPPGAPFPFRGNGKRDRAMPAPQNSPGGVALAV